MNADEFDKSHDVLDGQCRACGAQHEFIAEPCIATTRAGRDAGAPSQGEPKANAITITANTEGLVNFFGFPVVAARADVMAVLRAALEEYAVAAESAAVAVAGDSAHREEGFAQVRDEHMKQEAIARLLLDGLPAEDGARPEATPGLHLDEAWISSEPSAEVRALIEQHARAGRKDFDADAIVSSLETAAEG